MPPSWLEWLDGAKKSKDAGEKHGATFFFFHVDVLQYFVTDFEFWC